MAQLDEDAIRQRAQALAAQGVPGDEAGDVQHRMNPPLEVDEALDPGLSQKPDGLKWASGSDERGAGG